ncbi:hypothetical protein [Kitasatospora cineracea]|uniref:hypothetical protein n=1 Tax=Kitasatospora cineracea TaxID=88074 RepID=UPI000F488578|nr:hypothetical protein [Kitasatospora cineracea]
METYIIRGTAERPADCDACQKSVQRPIILETADRDGNPLGHYSHVGLDCAAKRTKKDRTAVEAAAERADKRRREDERRAAQREADRIRRDKLERQWLTETYGVDDIFDAIEKSGKDWSEVWGERNAWIESQ